MPRAFLGAGVIAVLKKKNREGSCIYGGDDQEVLWAEGLCPSKIYVLKS